MKPPPGTKYLLIAGILVLVPISVHAQASVSLGAAIPASPEVIRDAYSTGFSMWGAFGLSRRMIFSPRVVAGFDIIKTDKGFLRDVSERLGIDVEGGDLSNIFAGFDVLIVSGPGAVRPYIAPGAGLAVLSVGEFTVREVPFENVRSEQAFALTAAAGLAFHLAAGPHLLLEARVIHAFTEGDNFTWMPLNAGVFFDLD